MTGNKKVLESDVFYIEHLNPNDDAAIEAINEFSISTPEGQGLSNYLKTVACFEENSREMRT